MSFIYLHVSADDNLYDFISYSSPISLNEMYRIIDCVCIECVYTPYLRDCVMVIDESGKLKGKSINSFASLLYPGTKYGDPIVGNVLFMKRIGPDLVSLDDHQINILKFLIHNFDERGLYL